MGKGKLILTLICSIVLLSSCGKHATYSKDVSDNTMDTAINNFVLRDTSCMRTIKIQKGNIIEDFTREKVFAFPIATTRNSYIW